MLTSFAAADQGSWVSFGFPEVADLDCVLRTQSLARHRVRDA
jgi:hypothetical protein